MSSSLPTQLIEIAADQNLAVGLHRHDLDEVVRAGIESTVDAAVRI